MKITKVVSNILRIPEDDPLADMPEEAGRLRPIVIVRIQTDNGLEGIGVTLYGGALTGTLRTAIDELGALLVGEDPLRIEALLRKMGAAAGDNWALVSTRWPRRRSTSRCGISRARRWRCRCGSCWVGRATGCRLMRRVRCGGG